MKRKILASFKSTLVSGLTFSFVLVVVVWVLQKVGTLATKLAEPAMAMLPESLRGGIVVSLIQTGLLVVVGVYLAGLVARTSIAQRLIHMVHNSVIGSLPQFSFVRGITESIDDNDDDSVEVVLVPADAGWMLGFIFEASDAPFVAVFVPGAPQWTSGSVLFAERKLIKPAGVNFADAIRIKKKLGSESGNVVRRLTAS
jgi:uncharacterized membrane protein